VVRVNNLYKIDVEDYATLTNKVEKVKSRDVCKLWNRRLGHLLHGALKVIQQINTGLPKGELRSGTYAKDVLVGSVQNMHSMIRKTKCMQSWKGSTLIFLDLSKKPPIPDTHFLIFIDEFSRNFWIFFMWKKHEIFSKFLEFKALVEKQIDKKVKDLTSDNGSE